MAYAGLLGIDVRVLWLHGLVLWMENAGLRRGQSGRRAGGARAAGAGGGRSVGRLTAPKVALTTLPFGP